MIFIAAQISGAYLIDLERVEDDRGFFARSWCRRELEQRGLKSSLAQCSLSHNRLKGTLRGLHYQAPPHEEAKVVRCLRGRVFDVIVDLRPRSATYRQWTSAHLDGATLRAVYVPEGCAHGFLTLDDDTLVHYEISEFHHPECARGIRWDDPDLAIPWPIRPITISPRDLSFGRLAELSRP